MIMRRRDIMTECDFCGEIIKSNQNIVIVEDRAYHDDCFEELKYKITDYIHLGKNK